MKYSKEKRILCIFLSLVLMVSMLPVGVMATELAEEENKFILVVETDDELVLAPQYITYKKDQSIAEALTESEYTFVGLDEGRITEIEGVAVEYTYSDENGNADLNALASEVKYYRFSEEADSQPSEGLQQLMSAMAEYQEENDDVKAAVKEVYDTACAQFVGIDSNTAANLASELNIAISSYKNNQNDGTDAEMVADDSQEEPADEKTDDAQEVEPTGENGEDAQEVESTGENNDDNQREESNDETVDADHDTGTDADSSVDVDATTTETDDPEFESNNAEDENKSQDESEHSAVEDVVVTNTEAGSFILAVEAEGRLVIAPEYISYGAEHTIGFALSNSGHSFVGLEDGWITEIDGVVGNYSRSDENGNFDLNTLAAEIRYFRFCESEESRPSEGLLQLMSAMADYQLKPADVKAAAKEAYDTAYSQFVGLDSESAALLAEKLNEAVQVYENSQSGDTCTVTFTDGQTVHSGMTITAENAYGKIWTDDGDGILQLPAGDYTFCVNRDGLWVEGTIRVSADMTVTAALPENLWLNRDAFRLSGSYGAEGNEENQFSDDEYTLSEWSGRSVTVAVPDTFTGKIYTYAEYQVLTALPQLTAVYNSAKTGEAAKAVIPFESLTSGAADVLKKGATGNTVIYRVSNTAENGFTYSQDYTVEFIRIPTLASIRVADQNGVDQTAHMKFNGNLTAYTYKVVDTVNAVSVKAQPFDNGYTVTVNGKNAAEGVTVDVNGETTIEVIVSAGGYSNTYVLTIQPGEGRKLSFVTARQDVTLEVVNSNGEVLPFEKFREGTSGNRYQYVLVPGETYSYVATAATYYHIADEFTMEDVADSTIQVDVPVADWLTDLAFGNKSSGTYKNNLPLNVKFTSGNHSYQVDYVDTEHNAYIWVKANSGIKIQAIYVQNARNVTYHGVLQTLELDSGATSGKQLNRFLMDENPVENTVIIRLSKEVGGLTHYQDYEVKFNRSLTLESLSAKCDGVTTSLVQEDGTVGFAPNVKEYSVTVSMAAAYLDLAFTRYNKNTCYGEDEIGYTVEVDGTDVTEAGTAQIALNGTLETQNVTITVKNAKAPNGTAEYILHVLKSPPVETTFEITPEQAMLAVYEKTSGERLWPDDNGVFQFCENYNYDYALTCYGYISKSGTLQVTRDENKALVVIDDEQSYVVTETETGGGALTINWELEEAPVNSEIQTGMTAEWENFRGNSSNNGITDVAIPTSAEDGVLYWANKIGSGYSSDAVGSPILVDGDIITYARAKIYRVDTMTGEIKVSGDMDHKSAHATTPPSYAEGMVFVALTDGTVQAFNAKTLESLWMYKDPLGGQPICPLTIKNGYLYTGFWNSETGDANFVCLSITDEDPAQVKESKCASWYHTAKGGYYWAGAYASDSFVMVGTDDGTSKYTSQTSQLLLFDPITGELLDSWDNLNGDIRSTVVYDQVTNAYYFTSKGGTFYSVQVAKSENGWQFTNQWSVALANGVGGVPMSTCSPAVYKGRAYVGVSGAGQFAAYSGHNITVIDLTQKKIAYSVETQGYPQTSGLLTTAYEEESGYVYVYFFDNYTPGKLRVLRDKAGQTGADYVTTEGKRTTAYALFTPTGDHAEYAICSPIVDEYGTMYFKNDSARLMAFGSAVKKIEVTTQPGKMEYADGDTFDPTGMIVTATYANGKTRDVTKYVTFDSDKITADHTTVTISFPYALYHNEENGTAMNSGVAVTTPVTTLTVTIGSNQETMGDVTEDGEVDSADANMILAFYYGYISLTEAQERAADVTGDGEIDSADANMILAFYYGYIPELS